MDSPGVQLSRIAGASFHSVNLVRYPAPVTVGDLPPGLASVDEYLSSKILLCGLLDRLGTGQFPKFLLQERVVCIPKNDGSPDSRPLTVMSCTWKMWSRRSARHTGIRMDCSMPPSIFGARPCAAASDGAWKLLMDVGESRISDQGLTILTLDQIQCFDRLERHSLRELGSRLVMPRLALKALEAHTQPERYLFIDGQPTSMLIPGGKLRRVPGVCAVCPLLQLGGLGVECVHEEGTPACLP